MDNRTEGFSKEAEGPRKIDGGDLWLCSALFLVLCALDFLLQLGVWHRPLFTDDAFYYIVLARNFVQNHRSTFDGFTLTNGYHPLWATVLALQYKLFSQSLLLTRWIEYFLGLGTLLAALAMAELPNKAQKLVFTIGLFWALTTFAFDGMETTLFAFLFSLLACFPASALRAERRAAPPRGVLSGLLAAATIGARIDAAVFVLPQLLVSAKTWRRKIVAMSVAGVLLGLYALTNLHYFGVLFPISGEIKSLGGLQLNHILVHQLMKPSLVEIDSFYLPLVFFFLSLFIFRRVRNERLRSIQLALLIGFPIFVLRLFFLSSWRIWPWYGYPLLLGYIGCTPFLLAAIQRWLERFLSYRQILTAVTVVVCLLLAFLGRNTFHHHKRYPAGFFATNEEAAEQFKGILGGARVAMGDRSGSFAYRYGGGVDQLEGIMNDKEYFKVLSQGGDIRETLCRRDVRFVLAYEADLGGYQRYQVETINPGLSQYRAPRIEVRREDEVGRFSDLSEFSTASSGYSNVYLYIWKLHCNQGE